ncbi:MAG: DALR domain-containing protein, partial [archaeon]|nr:DALR domain-containing protein [archaeon]
MITLITRLEKKGYTYTTPQAVYFNVQKFPGYGKLSRQSLSELQAVRADVTRDPDKKHPADFRLWQLNQPSHAMQWDSPWGKGYPGWHIECSAMSMKYLGETFDIHTGGMDHIPIHHTNEIAQSEAATGKKYVHYWLHNAFIQIDKSKMAKSKKNFFTISDLEKKGFDALDYRYLLLTTHYRSELNFTWDSLEAAKTARSKWNGFIRRLRKYANKISVHPIKKIISETWETFDAFLSDDLNTPQAVASLSDFQRLANTWMEKMEISKSDARLILDFLKKADQMLGIFDFKQEEIPIPGYVLALAKKRQEARETKDWKRADSLRKEIEKEGYVVSDTKDGFELVPSINPNPQQ